LDYYDIVKPSFEINFWFKHFRGMDEDTARGYEAFLMAPIVDSMFFADTCEWYEEDYIDCTGLVDPILKEVDTDIRMEGLKVDGILIDKKEPEEQDYYEGEDEEGD
jgi:hypothetical protein